MRLWLAGGHQARPAGTTDRSHEPLYDRGVLAWLDPSTGGSGSVLTHRSPAGVCGPRPDAVGHTFKAGSVGRGGAWLCTEREVLLVAPDGRAGRRWSHPWLNDVHHVVELDGALHVVCSGLDAVLEVQADGPLFLPLRTGARPPAVDVRGADLKPHREHPNHLAEVDGRRWVTCGATGTLVDLDSGRRIEVADVPIHDGLPFEGGLLVTSVDGCVWQVDLDAGVAERRIDLRAGSDAEPLGWCRGLTVLDGTAWLGFTRLRATRLRHNLAWVRGRLRGRQVATRRPTRLVGVSLDTGGVTAEHELADLDLDALFWVSPAPTGG